MIRINFLANELAAEKDRRIQRHATLAYICCWIGLLTFGFLQLQQNQRIANFYFEKIEVLKSDIGEVYPQFKQSIELYQKRNFQRNKLKVVYEKACDSAFILESLERIASELPKTFWIEQIQFFISKPKVETDDDEEAEIERSIFKMIIKANLFLDFKKRDQNSIRNFQKVIQRKKPFSKALAKLNLNEMQVRKVDQSYAHNFEIEFQWPNGLF